MADAGPRWLSPQESDAWLPFGAVLLALPSALDAQLQRDAGITFFGYLVMAGLSEAPERTLRMGDLAVLVNGSLSRLSHTVARQEKNGWVRRHPMPGNGRITLATLTEAGYEKVVATAPGHVAAVRQLFVDVLTPEQLEALGDASRTVLAGLVDIRDPELRRRLGRC